MIAAIEANDLEVIFRLLPHVEDLNEENFDGDTPLLSAAWIGNPEAVRLLIKNGADVNYVTEAYFYTALMTASTQGHVEIVRLLLDSGADVDAADDFGYTSLMRAASGGRLEVVQMLLAHGADPVLVDDRGMTAADLAEDAGYLDVTAPRKAATPLQKLGWLRRFF